MAVFKCKMCGGDLNVTEDTKIIECEYCGTNQTIATADSEKKVSLFNRANRLRMLNDFDKAAVVYESIIADFPEEAEAYWGLCLCKYGIEYVDDPATGKKIPTCHRSSFESIMDDSDFEQVMEYSDSVSRKVYRDEAKQIEEIRRGIIEVSSNEEPYDIFICYKETDENGDRTLDSVIAQDVYDELTAKGYRIFFSRITLEDKLGVEYEPYIFAALNSAKIMLVFGTDYEYFNAVWVKNEWSRYLKLMAKDKTKHLIPCYKGVDAYDMPKEFAKLQAQDMGKVGATQDLMRGIEKILPQNKNVEPAPVTVAVPSAAASTNPSVDSYLKRVFAFLEDGNWQSADEYCEKVLDVELENAQAYLGKLMAELRVHTQEELKNQARPFNSSINYNKIKRYGDEVLVSTIDGYISCINERIEQARIKAEEERIRVEKELEQARIKAEEEAEKIKAKRLKANSRGFISAGGRHTVCLKADGTVISVGDNYYDQCNVGNWTYTVTVAAGSGHTVGIRTNGTVTAAGATFYGQSDIGDWSDIVSISAGFAHTVGLQNDGTVIAYGWNEDGQCDVRDWDDIIAVSAGNTHTVGLKSDGTVVAVGDNDNGQCDVDDWTDIVAVSTGDLHTVGLKPDGTVVAVGSDNFGQCNVSDWTDITAISAGDSHTVGLKSDGTVVAVGDNNYDQCSTNSWTDIVEVAAGRWHTVGLKSDGTVVAVGLNEHGQCNVNGLRLFNDINTVEQERETLMQAAHIGKQNLRNAGLCLYCGGTFKGLLTKKCTNCGREKDY